TRFSRDWSSDVCSSDLGFAPESVRGNPDARQKWAVNQLMLAAQASKNLGLTAHVTFPGALLWPYMYPWPQRPAGLVETGFRELRSEERRGGKEGMSPGE